MKLRVISESGLDKPYLVCEHCEETIGAAADAMCAWVYQPMSDMDGRVGDAFHGRRTADAVALHKKCQRAWQHNHGLGAFMSTCELKYLFVYLAHNHRVDLQAVRSEASRWVC